MPQVNQTASAATRQAAAGRLSGDIRFCPPPTVGVFAVTHDRCRAVMLDEDDGGSDAVNNAATNFVTVIQISPTTS
jgi:hypothetical protein